MLEEMVKSVVEKTLAQNHPHLELPAVVYARVASVTKLSETYEYGDITVEHDQKCAVFHGKVTLPWYKYTLAIIDRFGNADSAYPELPGIKSKKQFQTGAIVAVGLAYGDITPAIIGEVEL